ncbi:MAG: hypothetical protein RID09_30770 [Coleofasciculus sp. G1-WW12-02]|uniref:hypothetical protein n=1 Tax=Coleofasciculus sp. G1-WW12-02 TaxID=3068483 RepID=UPI0033039E74
MGEGSFIGFKNFRFCLFQRCNIPRDKFPRQPAITPLLVTNAIEDLIPLDDGKVFL